MSKTTLLALAIGDILKWEATNLTRESVPAEEGTKAGELVDFPLRGQKLVALTDEKDGKVVVQAHNCVINTDVLYEEIPANMISEGDAHGIFYIGRKKVAAEGPGAGGNGGTPSAESLDKLKQELKTEISKDVKDALKPEIIKEVKSSLKSELFKELKVDLKIELAEKVKSLKTQLKKELKAELLEELTPPPAT